MSLRQVYCGRKLSKLALEVDTLRFQSFVNKVQGRRMGGEGVNGAEHDAAAAAGSADAALGSLQVLQNSALNHAANYLLSLSLILIYLYQNEDRKEKKEFWECGPCCGRGL